MARKVLGTKRAHPAKSRSQKVRRKSSAGINDGMMDAAILGVAPGQIVSSGSIFSAPPEPDEPPKNLPVAAENRPGWSLISAMRRPLVSTRTAFWLGAGFGVLVLGSLGILIWEVLKVEVVEAFVIGLTRP